MLKRKYQNLTLENNMNRRKLSYTNNPDVFYDHSLLILFHHSTNEDGGEKSIPVTQKLKPQRVESS